MSAIFLTLFSLPAVASYMPFNTNVNMNVGIGTATPMGALAVMSGNVGIGTWVPGSALNVVGNVGIGSTAPNGALDVGAGLICLGHSCYSNWPSIVNWSLTGGTGNVGISTTNTVGIGTTSGVGAGLVVMNGNVGIGTWVPAGILQVNGSTHAPLIDTASGNVGIGTMTPQGGLVVMNGNVGIGTWAPNAALEVNSSGSGSWGYSALFDTSAGSVCNFSIYTPGGILLSNAGNGSYISFNYGTSQINLVQNNTGELDIGNYTFNVHGVTSSSFTGNLGIGTSTPQGALVVTNGNVGIGTWTAAGGNLIVIGGGNVGIGSAWPGQLLDVSGMSRMTGFTLTGNGAASGSVLVTNSIGVGTWMPINTIASAGTITPETANEIVYYGAASSQTLVGSSSMVFNAPNVGLGTITPLATLQVVGNIGIGTVANGDRFITTSPPNGGMIIEGNVGIGTSTPQGGLVVTNGNVGIGTWAPTAGLDVETSGNAYFAGNVGIGSSAPQNGFIYTNCATHSGQGSCWATNGAAGYCTSVVAAAGTCTCLPC